MISKPEYEFLCRFLQDKSGLSLGAGKEYLLEARLIPLAQSWGLAGLTELIAEVKRAPQQPLALGVVEAMTTNETLFFRDRTPFDELQSTWLPSLIDARRQTRQLRIWSAAASTGQEAYSLAMLIRDHFPELKSWRIEIVGTDLSKAAITRAEEAVYSQFEIQRGLPIQMLVRHFDQVKDGWKIKPELRQMVRFTSLNLLEPFQHLGLFDIIFCRNVLIYFDNPGKKHILDRMSRQLRTDGPLVLGAAETMLGITDTFDRARHCKAAVYVPRSLATV